MGFRQGLFVAYTVVLNALSVGLSNGHTIEASRRASAANASPNDLRAHEMDGKWLLESFDPVKDVYFQLFTDANPSNPDFLQIGDVNSLKRSSFDIDNEIRISIHGFRDGPGAIVNQQSRRAYLEKRRFNVIVVDWSKGADTLNYIEARDRIEGVGKRVAQLVEFIVETFPEKASLSKVGIIGHSLGAHVAGMVGKNIKQDKASFIYGLDPAGPLFYENEKDKRLDKDDAEYVAIIHTDAGTQGFEAPIGDCDFYPNYGRKQPGCGMDLTGACSHQRVNYLFGESLVTETGFFATPCSIEDVRNKTCTEGGGQVVLMGLDPPDREARGVYYLTTNDKSPFARGPVRGKSEPSVTFS